MKTELIKVQADWREVLNTCRATAGKPATQEPASEKFIRRILIAEHSPIREITVKWLWHLKSWIATHFSRHKWECFITTQRTDRTGLDRDNLPQAAPVDFIGTANAQHLIDTARKRLCYCSAPETREYMEDLKQAIAAEQPELALVMVPNCIYRCGCPELKQCGEFRKFLVWVSAQGDSYLELVDIRKRYELYQQYIKTGGKLPQQLTEDEDR